MRVKRRRRSNSGFTILEVVVALAIFAVVLAATADSLISYYYAMDLQEQRNAAAQNCRAVLSDMRDVRAANPNNYPGAILARWPDAADVPNAGTLPNEAVRVDYVDVNANPLEVVVTSTWNDMRGRRVTFSLSTLLTDR